MIKVFISSSKEPIYIGTVSKETSEKLIKQNQINKIKVTVSSDFIII
jgi:hypothetical protein